MALKREMVEATLDGIESVSVVARRYDVNANQLFRWRSQYRQGLLADEGEAAALLPITVVPPTQPSGSATPARHVIAESPDTGRLEVSFARGQRLVVTGTVCALTLRTVLEVLSR